MRATNQRGRLRLLLPAPPLFLDARPRRSHTSAAPSPCAPRRTPSVAHANNAGTRAASPADEVAAAKLSSVVFTSFAPTRTISTTKTKTAAQPPVTKPIHETKLEIVTEPFVPTPEKASPPKIVKQPLEESPAA